MPGWNAQQCAYTGCENLFDPNTGNRKYCDQHRTRHGWGQSNTRRMRRDAHELQFIGIDGEGTGKGSDHRYVLLGAGDKYTSWPNGVVDIGDIFGFLYDQYLDNPDAVFAGFFLAYDFNSWLKLLPRERAAMLLTDQGKAKRARRNNGNHLPPFAVEYKGWQFDMLGYKRFKLAPKGSKKWMYINDTGPFFQTSLMGVIDPQKWPDGGVVTQAEYKKLKAGKERRSDAVLDQDMIEYNMLENDVLARVLERLNEGFSAAGVRLDKRQWYGPGQAAQKWMGIDHKLDIATESIRAYPHNLHDALVASYYGGWFEIAAHGIVPGVTYEYDINSAYPYAISRLPCCCGRWRHGHGNPGKKGILRLCKVHVIGNDPMLGPLPYRTRDGRVLRPLETAGWYWEDEIQAARHAGLIKEVTYHEWWEYGGCGKHKAPLRGIRGLYDERLRVGKETPLGKADKLIANSAYGKIAQSVGDPRYANALYASRITSGCRTQILDAIASHPARSKAVVMVATDAVYFTSPHPSLPVSQALGDWSAETHERLTLFKPGVYWNDETRTRIRIGRQVAFKARGISARDFAKSIGSVDDQFGYWKEESKDNVWPEVRFRSVFSQVSITQALQWSERHPGSYRALAGRVMENRELTQSADPSIKRDSKSLYRDEAGVWRTRPWRHRGWPESTPYSRQFGWDDAAAEFDQYVTPDGSVLQGFRDALGVG